MATVWMDHSPTQSSTDGHLGGFHLLAAENNAAVNTGAQIPESLPSTLPGTYPEAELLADVGIPRLSLAEEIACCFP